MKTEVVDKLAALITAAFGLVAALAWNDAIHALFVGPCGAENAGALCSLAGGGPWVYAIIVTVLAVGATIWIGYVAQKGKDGKLKLDVKKLDVKKGLKNLKKMKL